MTLLLSLYLMLQAGTIEGQVMDSAGNPAAAVRIAAQAVPDAPNTGADAAVLASIVQTDSNGRYRLENVPPGRYYITAGLVEFPTYYPGVTGTSDAKIVAVTAGAPLTGYDFKLSRPAGLRIHGHITREGSSAAPPNQRVIVSGTRPPSQNAIIATDGSFEFTNLPPGRYSITLSPANGALSQQIVLDDKDLSIDLVAPLTVTVTGSVVVEGGGPRPRLNLAFSDGANRIAASFNSNGAFNVQLPPGKYQITTVGQLTAGYSVRSIVSGTTDLTTSPLIVGTTPPPQFMITLNVSSPPPWVRVRGQVVNSSNTASAPQPGARVTMTGGGTGEILDASVGDDGTFEFPKVLPGNYSARITGAVSSPGVPPTTLLVGSSDVLDWKIVQPSTIHVSGRVTIEGLSPTRQMRIPLGFVLSSVSSAGGGTTSSRFSAAADSNGNFNLALPEGQYRIALSNMPAGYTVKSMAYGTTDLLSTPVPLNLNEPQQEMNVVLARSTTTAFYSIRGRVLNSAGRVQISVLGGASSSLGGRYDANEDGTFEIPQVVAGSYTLRAFSVSQGIDVALPVTVATRDLTDVEIRIPPQRRISGRVSMDDGDVNRSSIWYSLTGSSSITLYGAIQPDGSFILNPPIGQWNVSIGGLGSGLTVKSFTYGDTDLLHNPLQISDTDNKEVRVTLSSSIAKVKVSGHILIPNISVLGSSMNLMGDAQYTTGIRPDGTFEFDGIIPGHYQWCCNYGWTAFTVPKEGISNLVFQSIEGQVVGESLSWDRDSYVHADQGNRTSAASMQRDGKFTLVAVEGETYRITLPTIPAGYYIKSISYGSAELKDQTLQIPKNDSASTLRIEIARR